VEDAVSQAAVRERWAMGVEARALTLVMGVLMAFGLAVLYSASSIYAVRAGDNSMGAVVSQLLGVVAGVILFALCAKLDADRWANWAWPFLAGCALLMLIIVLPVGERIAPTVLGANRVLNIPFVGRVQPSEFAKLGVIIWTAMLIVKKGEVLRHLLKGLTPFLLVVGGLAMLAAWEPDISVALTLLLIMGVILFASGARIGHFLFLGILGVPVLWRLLDKYDYVWRRIDAILHPGSGAAAVAPQLNQSIIAVGSGQLFGRGFGSGMQQSGWVPLGHSDFIGSVIGEEFGFLGMLFLIGLYTLYGYLGFRIASQARSRFLELVAIGITFTMVFTAFVHLGVVIGILPTTGLTLPFISYGRWNLLLSFVMTGILVNIGSSRERVYAAEGAENKVPIAVTA
jgi:cell division protein FtsW